VRKLLVSILLLSSFAAAKEMGWVPVAHQTYRMEPARWQAAGNYGPGMIHLNIGVRASSGVNMGLVRANDWERGFKTPMQCQTRGLVNSNFSCDYEAKDAMVLLIQDQRLPGDVAVATITGGWRGAASQLTSTNVVTLSTLEWGCVAGCSPSWAWVNVSKEKFDLYPIAKTYGPITPDHDDSQVNVKMKAKQPMLLAILPVAQADRLRANPAEAETILAGAPCKQRAVEKADLTCRLNIKDGTQQVVLLAEPGIPVKKKKVEVHITMVRCVANCSE
jgi:hypothetical protein